MEKFLMIEKILFIVLWLLGLCLVPMVFFYAFELITGIPVYVVFSKVILFWLMFYLLKFMLNKY